MLKALAKCWFTICVILFSQYATLTNASGLMPDQAEENQIMEDAAMDQDDPAPEFLSITNPKRMAVLLPLTGPLAGPGNAVRDGFLAAYKSNGSPSEIKIHFYDTYSKDVNNIYAQALDDGADYIVGPLTKNEVAVVAKLEHPVPTLLLNDFNSPLQSNTYQFGLSPTQEAKQAAVKMQQGGYGHSLVIAPSGAWGEEIASAFSAQFIENGGQVIDILYYSSQQDLNKSIKNILNITDSENRSKQLKNLLGYQLEAPPKRRQDFDAIFLLAYPSMARQIMPMLKYYYVGNIPVFSTSTVYAGYPNQRRDKDLDGIIFCDMPWIFKHTQGPKNWPEQFNSYNRLYALGQDSYELAAKLNLLKPDPHLGLKQKSGILYLSANQQIGRALAWAKFKDGEAQLAESVV